MKELPCCTGPMGISSSFQRLRFLTAHRVRLPKSEPSQAAQLGDRANDLSHCVHMLHVVLRRHHPGTIPRTQAPKHHAECPHVPRCQGCGLAKDALGGSNVGRRDLIICREDGVDRCVCCAEVCHRYHILSHEEHVLQGGIFLTATKAFLRSQGQCLCTLQDDLASVD